eukprot:12907504-Prorocentrum_lima.AAC.1
MSERQCQFEQVVKAELKLLTGEINSLNKVGCFVSPLPVARAFALVHKLAMMEVYISNGA